MEDQISLNPKSVSPVMIVMVRGMMLIPTRKESWAPTWRNTSNFQKRYVARQVGRQISFLLLFLVLSALDVVISYTICHSLTPPSFLLSRLVSQEDHELYEKVFANYIKEGVTGDEFEDLLEKVGRQVAVGRQIISLQVAIGRETDMCICTPGLLN